MPNWTGPNSRAREAQLKKEEKKNKEKLEKERKLDDLKWKDEVTESILEKKQKKLLKEKEKEKIKAENRRLALEEETKYISQKQKKDTDVLKLTRSQIESRSLNTILELLDKNKKKDDIPLVNPNLIHPLEEFNPNLEKIEVVSASGIENILKATAALNDDNLNFKMPKITYKMFEAEQLPLLKKEYPTLKLSQLKSKIFKKWQKCPENPMNKSFQ